MAKKPTAAVAAAILREVPLSNLGSFVSNMSATDGGGGCGGGCGNGCGQTIDRFGHVLDARTLSAAAADKAGLLKEIRAQIDQHFDAPKG